MIYKYAIEIWNPDRNKYIEGWSGSNLKMAKRMFEKSYYAVHTRRMIRYSREILYTDHKSRED